MSAPCHERGAAGGGAQRGQATGGGRVGRALCAGESRRGRCSPGRGPRPSNMLITGTGRRRDEDVAADSPVRWGILGTGGIATTFVTDLGLTGSGVAVAVGSRSQGSADGFAGGGGSRD